MVTKLRPKPALKRVLEACWKRLPEVVKGAKLHFHEPLPTTRWNVDAWELGIGEEAVAAVVEGVEPKLTHCLWAAAWAWSETKRAKTMGPKLISAVSQGAVEAGILEWVQNGT